MIAPQAHSSFNSPRTFLFLSTFPEPSCWPNCKEGGPGVSQTCRRRLGSGPCPSSVSISRRRLSVSGDVGELAALSILHFELVVIEVVHQVLGEIQNAHAHIHWAIEY